MTRGATLVPPPVPISNGVVPSRSAPETSKHKRRYVLPLSLLAGAVLGLSAPGIDLFWIAWVGVTPLILLIVSSKKWTDAFLRGFAFGLGYNLVYLNWLLAMHPLNWAGYSTISSLLVAVASWLVVATQQGFQIGLFAIACRLFRWTPSLVPQFTHRTVMLPAILGMPFLWVLIMNKLGNLHCLLGFPWTMIEYSQYRVCPLIQAASIIGGIGIGYCIVTLNVITACLWATFSKNSNFNSIAYSDKVQAGAQTLSVLTAGAIGAWVCYTDAMEFSNSLKPNENVYVLQTNCNTLMTSAQKNSSSSKTLCSMLESCHDGLCITPEHALGFRLDELPLAKTYFEMLARNQKLNILVGIIRANDRQNHLNSAFGFNSHGEQLPPYDKRYLVPFLEYTPASVVFIKRFLVHARPQTRDFESGNKPNVLKFPIGDVAPLICFEAVSPELAAASVRAGGQLLVNLGDQAWFHNSIVGQQMIAFATFRAIENRRYFVSASCSGPSAIIDPLGRTLTISKCSQKSMLSGKIQFISTPTVFTKCFKI